VGNKILDDMILRGCDSDNIIAVAELIAESSMLNKRRARNREQMAASRLRKKDVSTRVNTGVHIETQPECAPLLFLTPLPDSSIIVGESNSVEADIVSKDIRGRATRGTRLPEDWNPSKEDVSFAEGRGWGGSDLQDEVLKFKNYWCSKTGKDATKKSWSRTWQNWILNARKQNGSKVNGRLVQAAEGPGRASGGSAAQFARRRAEQLAELRRRREEEGSSG